MKVHIKIRTVKGSLHDMDTGTLPGRNQLVMVGLCARTSMPAPVYYVPCVYKGDAQVEFALAGGNTPPIRLVPGDVWFPIPRNMNHVPVAADAPVKIDESVKKALDELAESVK